MNRGRAPVPHPDALRRNLRLAVRPLARPVLPAQAGAASWLEHYAARFQTAEVNNTFYNLPAASVFETVGGADA